MNQSEQINELASALIKVQANLKPAHKDSENPFFKSSYASLTSVWEACRKLLTDNNLAVVQTTSAQDADSVTVQTTLVHSSGQWIRGELRMRPQKNDPQGIGSAISYSRRYSLAAMVGVCPEDDDAEGAMDRKEVKPALTQFNNGKSYNNHPKTEVKPSADVAHFKDVLKNHQEFFGEHAWKKYFTSKKGEIPTLEQIYQWKTPAQLDWLGRSLERMEKELFAAQPDEPLIPNVND